MFGILGEEEFDAPAKKESSGLLSSIGSTFKNLLEKGADIYTLQQQQKIANIQLQQTQAAAATKLMPTTTMLGAGSSMVPTQQGSGFPVLPIVAGLGAIGAVLLLTRKKK